jgi:hypothetical protein
MKNIFLIFLLVHLSCSRNEPNNVQYQKTNAKFKVYVDFQANYFEEIDRDTFEYRTLTFKALDSTKNTNYIWNIDGKTFNYKEFNFDFSNYSKNSVNIQLITQKEGYNNDTSRRTIHLKSYPLQETLRNTTKFQLINEKDIFDTLNLTFIRRTLNFRIDTILANGCELFPTEIPNYTVNELTFSAIWYDTTTICNNNKYVQILYAFMKTDMNDKNKVYLRFEAYKRISQNNFEKERTVFSFIGRKLN